MGIRFMGFHVTNIQPTGNKSQLLSVFSSGYSHARSRNSLSKSWTFLINTISPTLYFGNHFGHLIPVKGIITIPSTYVLQSHLCFRIKRPEKGLNISREQMLNSICGQQYSWHRKTNCLYLGKVASNFFQLSHTFLVDYSTCILTSAQWNLKAEISSFFNYFHGVLQVALSIACQIFSKWTLLVTSLKMSGASLFYMGFFCQKLGSFNIRVKNTLQGWCVIPNHFLLYA